MNWLDANAEGIALMAIIGAIAILLLVGALCIERLVEPRHERTHAGRRAQARTHQPLPRPDWTPPSGWVDGR